MFNWKGRGLTFGELKVESPIVQGGMGVGVSANKLATAVANAGGVGVISAVGLGYIRSGKSKANDNVDAIFNTKEEYGDEEESNNIKGLREEIRIARKNTNGVLGVNIMVAISEFEATVKAAIQEGIDIIFAGAGLPLNLPAFKKEGDKTKLIPIVSSAKAAKLISMKWQRKYDYLPDGFVVEGPKAGGHLGFKVEDIEKEEFALENLVKEVCEVTKSLANEYGKKIPVIAGGGIYTGADIFNIMKLGASGVQMATRFVATEECDASPEFKQAYIDCTKEDIGIIKSPVGLPGRAIIGDFLKSVELGNERPKNCPWECIKTCKKTESPYCISKALINALKGNLNRGFAFIGANGYRVKKIVKVKELFKELHEGFFEAEKIGKDGLI